MNKDYSGKKLQGKNFKYQNLEDCIFNNSDIRGADFTNANLKNAKFQNIESGLQRYWAIILVILSFLLVTLFVFLLEIVGQRAGDRLFSTDFSGIYPDNIWNSLWSTGILVGIFIVFVWTIRKGLEEALKIIIGVGIFAVGLTALHVLIRIVLGSASTAYISGPLANSATASVTGIGIVAVAVAVAVGITVAQIVAGHLGRAIAILGSLLIVTPAALIQKINGASNIGIATGCLVALAGILLGNYLASQALKLNEGYALVRNIAIAFATTGGTSFVAADLTDADFTQAVVRSTDFREANITRTCWFQTKKLKFSRMGESYLKRNQLQQLLTKRDVEDKNFDGQNLRGLNFSKAQLINASFIGTDLYQTKLKEANLSGAKLVRVQLEQADLTGACLTGACIEDWVVTRTTKLDGVVCKYVYMKFVDGDKRELMPPKGEFKDGEFILFIRSILDTLELYHETDINPRAAVIVLKSLSEEYNEPLQIVGLERRGDGTILKLRTPEWANQEQLKQEYYTRYSQTLTLSIADPKKLLPQYEILEAKVTEMLEEVKQRPTTNIKYLYNKGLFVTGGDASMNNYDLRGSKFGGGFAGTEGTQTGGTFTDYSSNPNLSTAASEIQQILKHLEVSNPTTTRTEKMILVAKVVDEIEKNPSLKTRVIAVLNSVNSEAFKQAINHPLARNIVSIIEEWTEEV
ncbi:pentapeptide repeat-containing protein [Microcoleus sp. ZQ-A2]|nr:pentapeptide repeat-containing protein [Microcoleus sp. FACHB-1]